MGGHTNRKIGRHRACSRLVLPPVQSLLRLWVPVRRGTNAIFMVSEVTTDGAYSTDHEDSESIALCDKYEGIEDGR